MVAWGQLGEICRQGKAAARLIGIMGVAKYLSGPALSFILVVGLLCSQICAFNCSFYGCSISSPIPTSENLSEHGHCHQHKENTVPHKRDDSPQCPNHFDAVSLGSSKISVYKSHQGPSADVLIIHPSLTFNASSERQAVQAGGKPDRSPPAHSVLRI